ncbi:MAG TPA: hypothetical protein PLE24_06110 [Chitinispirillaceae bacterium]|mgnify:CR=1 FL=1|nr:hypothetical protein [Chitinispirillaceae bacterium]
MYQLIVLSLLLISSAANAVNLSGKVTNKTGKPIANATVSLVKEGSSVKTNSEGLFSITSVSNLSPITLAPANQKITLENGVLKFNLPDAVPVKVELFDIKGKLLGKEVLSDASSGFYSFNIGNKFRSKLLIVRATLGDEQFLFRYAPLSDNHPFIQSRSTSLAGNSGLAKMAAIDDTIRVTAENYKTKSVPITSYEQDNINITLDSANGNCCTAGCGKNPTLKSGKQTIQVNGQQREFMIRIPENYDNTRSYPVVFAFHWNGGSMNDVDGGGSSGYTWSYYGLREQADKSTDKQMIFIAPNGLNAGWANSGGRDIAFVDEILKRIKEDLCVDTTRIFALGFSYGGGMSYSLACSRANVFRAVAVYAGAQLSGCDGGTTPIAYLGIHGISDPTCSITAGRSLRDRFVNNNGCTAQNPPEPSRGSNTHICTRYQCRDGYPVEWCAFDGGHTPGHVEGGGDDGARTWTKKKAWDFFTQF